MNKPKDENVKRGAEILEQIAADLKNTENVGNVIDHLEMLTKDELIDVYALSSSIKKGVKLVAAANLTAYDSAENTKEVH